MSVPHHPPLISQALRDRAASWHVRLSSDAADEGDWLAFESWLAESAAHQRAYEAVETVWSELDDLPATARSNVASLRLRRRVLPATWMGAVAASLVAFLVLGALLWTRPETQSFQTAFGERREVALSDGSHITLNGGSSITTAMGRRERRVEMADAEAVFDVAKDPSRPFLIQAGDREIRVVGTQFNVLRHDGEVRVTVRRGIVEIRPAGASSAPPLARLVKGQSLSHREGQSVDVVAAADPEAAFAWTAGRLVFQDERLANVAVTLNRYVKTPIVVAPAVQDLKVTATLVVGPEDDMLRSLAAFLPVQVEQRTDSVRLSPRRQAR